MRQQYMSTNIEKVFVTYDGIFCDELDVKTLYNNQGNIEGYENENGESLSWKDVVGWVITKYFIRIENVNYSNGDRVRFLQDKEKLYLCNEEYKELVDVERMYILYLLDLSITKIAEIFGVSRPTVYKKIKAYEGKTFPQ